MQTSDKKRPRIKGLRKTSAELLDIQTKTPKVGGARVIISGSKNYARHLTVSQKSFGSPEESINYKHALPKLPKNLADEIRQNFLIRATIKLKDRRKLISQVMERRRLKQSLATSTKKAEMNKTIAKNEHFVNQIRQKQISRCNENDTSLREPTSNKGVQNELIQDGNRLHDQNESVNHSYKVECFRYRKEIQILTTKLITKDQQNLLLRQKVNQLTSETKVMRSKLIRWQTKSKSLSELQNEDIAMNPTRVSDAPIELAEALDDATNLEAIFFDSQTTIDERDKHADMLYDTIECQAKTMTDLTTKLRDKEILPNLNENEKRKLQDEVQVVIASKDGDGIENTLRHLEERVREPWLSDREKRKKKVTQIMLKRGYSNTFGREKSEHRQGQEVLKENSSKKRQLEENQQETLQFLNQQLRDTMKTNHEIKQRHMKERQDMVSEIKEKNAAIVSFALQISNLNKQISTLNQSIESLTKSFQVAQKQNERLQEKIKELTGDDDSVKKWVKILKTQKEEIESIDNHDAHYLPNQLSKEGIQELRSYGEQDLEENQRDLEQSNSNIDRQNLQKQSKLSNQSMKRLKSRRKKEVKTLKKSLAKSKKTTNQGGSEKLNELLQGGMEEFRSNDRIKQKTLPRSQRKWKKHDDRYKIRRTKPKKKESSEEFKKKTKNEKKKRKKKKQFIEEKSKNWIDKQLEKKHGVGKTREQQNMKREAKLNTVTTPETNECSLAVLKLDDSLSTDSGQNSSRIPRSIIFTPIQ